MGKLKKKTRNPGVGIDFKRVKHKVGKKLPKARNETDTDFKSRSINLPNQAVREDRSNVAVNYQNLTLKELLNQTSHHNDKSRKHSLIGLADLFRRHPEQLRLHAAQSLGILAERIVDGDSGVRSALRELLNDCVLPSLGADTMRPFMPLVMAHVCGAMTHLSLDVRNDALLFLDVMMNHVPLLVVDGFLAPCLAHFCDLFSAAHRGRSIRAQSLAALTKLLAALTSFLRRAFPGDDTVPATGIAAAGGSTGNATGGVGVDMDVPGHAGCDGRHAIMAAEAEAAGPGPSSMRQQQLRVQAASLTARPGTPLGADRTRRPLRSGGDLLRQLDELFRAAAAVTRSGRMARIGKAGGAENAAVDKNRHKKGRGSVSMTETATAASGGKSVGAAAAALAAVTAPAAAAAAGVDLSAGSGSAAAGLLGASTTMAAALAAASDARASALHLVTLLMNCWLECNPAELATSPEIEQVNALAMIAAACNHLIERLLLPRHYHHHHHVGCGDTAQRYQFYHQPQQNSVGRQQQPSMSVEQRLALTEQLHDVVAQRVAAHFPAVLPSVKPQALVVEALVRLNLQAAELLGRFLPLNADRRPKEPPSVESGARGAITLPWMPAFVSFYVGALEHGLLLPTAAGTLSDASGTAAAQGLSASTADTVLAAVSAALGQLDDLAAGRLMEAVARFAARQPPRSAARLACIRMQHSLLRSALDGWVFLPDGAVVSWLERLPKLLWEVRGSSGEVSAAALMLLLDAARFAAPGSAMSKFLSSELQPQLAPLFAVQMLSKAAKPALAKYAASLVGTSQTCPGLRSLEPSEVLVLVPGVVSKLPDPVGCLAVDLIYHLGDLNAALLKAIAAVLSSAALPASLSLRLLDVALSRQRNAPDPALVASWLLTLMFGPQHGQLVLSPEGADLTASWGRQRALVDAVVMGLGQLGGAAALLAVLAPQLAELKLANAASAGSRGARLQRYSFVRLCATALGEDAREGLRVPEGLAETLPAAAALCGVETGAAAVLEPDLSLDSDTALLPYRSTFGPVVQLLTERPGLTTMVVRHLSALLRQVTPAQHQAAPLSPLVGALPQHTAALAALQLVQVVVKLPPVRTTLAASAADREGLVSLVKEMVETIRKLPVAATGSMGSDHAANCGLESQRLVQMVADLYGRQL